MDPLQAPLDVRTELQGHFVFLNRLVKGMVHIITMLTYIAQIDIGEYKNPFKCPEITLVNLFWLLYVP